MAGLGLEEMIDEGVLIGREGGLIDQIESAGQFAFVSEAHGRHLPALRYPRTPWGYHPRVRTRPPAIEGSVQTTGLIMGSP